jgi:uncharacterized membrane protein YbhN (UPF0104 family)
MKKILLNLLSLLLILAIFYFLGREFLQNWEQIRAFPFQFHLSTLALASLFYAATFIIFALGWWLLLGYLHHPIPLFETLLYFFITQPAKYIPGKIWIAITRMKFCKPHGVPNSITLLTTGIEAAMEILAGSYISLIAILQTDLFGKYSLWGTLAITGIGLILLIPNIFYFFINIYLKIAKREPIQRAERVSFPKLLLLQLNYFIGMLGLGWAQLLFLQSFAPVGREHFPLLMSIGAFSYVASILAIFTPSGLGVREGIWYLALKGITAPAIAIIYAFVSRLWTIIVEAILLFMALPLLWIRKRRAKIVNL